MKLTICAILVFTVFLNYTSFTQDNNNLEKLELKGKVKSINTISYGAVVKSDKIKKGDLSKPSGAEVDRTLFFSPLGILAEEQQFDFSGDLFATLAYQYDANGNIISIITAFTNGIVKERIDSNVYDQNDFLVEKYSTFKYREGDQYSDFLLYEKYQYDINGNIIEEILFKENLKLFEQNNYLYNESGYMIEMILSYQRDEIKLRVTYTCNATGAIVEENQYASNEKLVCTTFYLYDDFGNIAKMNRSFPNGLQMNFGYDYIYDDQGNWIQKIEYWQGKPLYLIERKIIYYK